MPLYYFYYICVIKLLTLMKKILTLILLATLFISCGSDDDDNPVQGEWLMWIIDDSIDAYQSEEFTSDFEYYVVNYVGDNREAISYGKYTIEGNYISFSNLYNNKPIRYEIINEDSGTYLYVHYEEVDINSTMSRTKKIK